ncbi:MAG: histidinol-phosphate transaminase [Gammaproteobacteria bacterium]
MSIQDWVTSGVRGLQPYQPGKPVEELERELGITGIIKLASNENPKGASPLVADALKTALSDLARYPDGSGFSLKSKLARFLGIRPHQITLGNGSNDVLEIITRCFVGPGEGVVISEHAFAVYYLAAKSVDAHIAIAPAQQYGHDLKAMRKAIGSDTKLVFIANPNNPTGTHLTSAQLLEFLEDLPKDTLVVLDEAYVEYTGGLDHADGLTLLDRFPNLIVTRTFSKAYGIAALRVGFAVASEAVTEILNRVRQPFNVNTLALVAAEAALEDQQFVAESVLENKEGLERLIPACSEMGIESIPSAANFICVRVGSQAQEVYDAMLRMGVIVRPVANYGLPEHLRITIGTPQENERLIETLRSALLQCRAN